MCPLFSLSSVSLLLDRKLTGLSPQWFVFSLSDNDFITQDGFMDGGAYPYADASGFNLDNQALVFKIKLPDHSRPFNRDS